MRCVLRRRRDSRESRYGNPYQLHAVGMASGTARCRTDGVGSASVLSVSSADRAWLVVFGAAARRICCVPRVGTARHVGRRAARACHRAEGSHGARGIDGSLHCARDGLRSAGAERRMTTRQSLLMIRTRLIGLITLAALPACARLSGAPVDDLVILHGRVMDPESGLDA